MNEELIDILDCIIKFDIIATDYQKARYFDTIQGDLYRALNKTESIKEVKDFIDARLTATVVHSNNRVDFMYTSEDLMKVAKWVEIQKESNFMENWLKDMTSFVRQKYNSSKALKWYVDIIQEYKKHKLNK